MLVQATGHQVAFCTIVSQAEEAKYCKTHVTSGGTNIEMSPMISWKAEVYYNYTQDANKGKTETEEFLHFSWHCY